MNPKLRILAGILSGLVLAGTVTACGSDAKTTATTAKAGATTTAKAAETTAKPAETTTPPAKK